MPTRVVMVEFNPGVSAEDVGQFKAWLTELAGHTSGLVNMECGAHFHIEAEGGLSPNAPSVTFGHFVSIWTFVDRQALENFVLEPFHHQMAGKHFRQLVAHRYVTNIP